MSSLSLVVVVSVLMLIVRRGPIHSAIADAASSVPVVFGIALFCSVRRVVARGRSILLLFSCFALAFFFFFFSLRYSTASRGLITYTIRIRLQ